MVVSGSNYDTHHVNCVLQLIAPMLFSNESSTSSVYISAAMSGVDKLADVRTATRTMLLCLLVTVQCVKQPLFHMTVCVLNYCSVYIVCYAVYGVQMCMLYISNGILG